MFRDGIFESFGDFLDSIRESTLKENMNQLIRSVVDLYSDKGYKVDPEDVHFYLMTLPSDDLDYLEEQLAQGNEEEAMSVLRDLEFGRQDESKTNEVSRKIATDTELPDKEPPEGDAERLSMEDWCDTDKDGKPKRKDKVEYPSKLREPTDKEMSDEVKYERKKDPLYLCNDCFKTFRASEAVCKCGSRNVERIGKIKEFQDTTGRAPADYVEKHPGKFEVVFYDGTKVQVDADSKWDAKEKASGEYGKRVSQVNQLSSNESIKETVQELVGETPGINRHDQEILNWAIEHDVISNEWPNEEQMIDQLSMYTAEEAETVGKGPEDVHGLDLGEIEAAYLKYILLPKAKEEYVTKSREVNLEKTVGESKTNEAPKVKMTTGSGTSYYAECPKCGATNWLSSELTTNSVVCKECRTPFKLGEEVEHEDYIRREIPEKKMIEGNWWQQLLNDVQKDVKFKEILEQYGMESDEVFRYFADKYWSKSASRNSVEVALQDVVKELNLEESKVNEQDVETLRKRRMNIEQQMLQSEKKYKEEQNRLGSMVDELNQKIKELEKKESKLKEQDENGYKTIAKGIEDERSAQALARDKDGQVIEDPEDSSKFAVIVKKER
jgi:hypothetical protein